MSSENRTERIATLFTELAELISSSERPEIPAPRANIERVLLTVEEAAERLNIGRTRMFDLVKSGDLESVQIGRLRRIHLDALERFARHLQQEQNPRKEPDDAT